MARGLGVADRDLRVGRPFTALAGFDLNGDVHADTVAPVLLRVYRLALTAA